MSIDFHTSLATIEAFLIRFKLPVSSLLNAGIPGNQTSSALLRRGLAAGPQLMDFYEWHDGTSAYKGATLGHLHMIPGFYFLELEDALANYDAFLRGDRWNPSWLPLLADGGGDFYAVDCSGRQDRQGTVHRFRIDEDTHPLEYRSIGAMLATFAEAFAADAFFVAPDGYLEMDDGAYGRIARSLNPTVPWWSH